MLHDPCHQRVAGLAGQGLTILSAGQGCRHVLKPLVVGDQRRVAVNERYPTARAHFGARGGQGLEGGGIHPRERRGAHDEAGDAQRRRAVGDVGQVQARTRGGHAGGDVPRTHADHEAVRLSLRQARQDLGLPARCHLPRRLGGDRERQEGRG